MCSVPLHIPSHSRCFADGDMNSVLFSVLERLQFGAPRFVWGRASIADLVPCNARCGVYVLHFSNGDLYAGQAVNVCRRYCQHRFVHPDIEHISFKPICQTDLSAHERNIIGELELCGLTLRNISLVTMPTGDCDFDLVMPPAQQQGWLDDPDYVDLSGSRFQDDEHRRRYARRFQKYMTMKDSTDALDVLREYVRAGIPRISEGEMSMWSVSCLPGGHRAPKMTIYSRLNVGLQEVCTVGRQGRMFYTFHMARSPLCEVFGKALGGLRRRYIGLTIEDHRYPSGGTDQIMLLAETKRCALSLVKDRDVVRAIRIFNLGLMRKGMRLNS